MYHDDPRTRPVLDAAFLIHSTLGPGLLEGAYEACLAHTLAQQGHDVRRQVQVPLHFHGLEIDAGYRLDLLIDQQVVVEVKAVDRLLPVHSAQLLTYLRFSGFKIGLLLNFNVTRLRDGIVRRANDGPTVSP